MSNLAILVPLLHHQSAAISRREGTHGVQCRATRSIPADSAETTITKQPFRPFGSCSSLHILFLRWGFHLITDLSRCGYLPSILSGLQQLPSSPTRNWFWGSGSFVMRSITGDKIFIHQSHFWVGGKRFPAPYHCRIPRHDYKKSQWLYVRPWFDDSIYAIEILYKWMRIVVMWCRFLWNVVDFIVSVTIGVGAIL